MCEPPIRSLAGASSPREREFFLYDRRQGGMLPAMFLFVYIGAATRDALAGGTLTAATAILLNLTRKMRGYKKNPITYLALLPMVGVELRGNIGGIKPSSS